jgi:xylulose-5-phosphate/fructose-6-phosphate phosphoketolase
MIALSGDRTRTRLEALDAYWRAANYLGAAQLYLRDNVLLRDPLEPDHVKPRPLGHWGTQPGLNLIYAHLNRLIADTNANVMLVVGPGHGAPAILANLYLEETLEFGAHEFIKRFSWPGGAPSHLTAETPGTIHEGGELGYALSHAFGAALDNPDLIVACVVGDGEAETGPLAASWRFNTFLNPQTSGAVLPILHLNGYKLSGPAIFGRMTNKELTAYFEGLGFAPIIVEAEDLGAMHANVWDAFDRAYASIRAIQDHFRFDFSSSSFDRFSWPVIVLRTEKGVGGPFAGTSHSHGLPLADPARDLTELGALDRWLRSYKPQTLFDEAGCPNTLVRSILPPKELRMGRNPSANGGNLLVPLVLPASQHLRPIGDPGSRRASAMQRGGEYLADVFRLNADEQNFRFFCPDETTSNKLGAIFDVTSRAFMGPIQDTDDCLSPAGRAIEILSEHCCAGWLEGYVATGRHGVFACYEGFIPIVDSMVHQYGKWLKMSREVPWRKPTASLNLLLTSHVWRQDHNGYSHQGPGFIDSLLTSKSAVTRVYLPPDANTLVCAIDHCLASLGYINLIVSGKNQMPQWLSPDEAQRHCAAGLGVWEWASKGSADPEIVLACCGDVPTQETLAAAKLLDGRARVRVVNIFDLMRIASPAAHPHGISDEEFERLFPTDVPVVFAFHGYPHVIHQLLHGRKNSERFHVRGYIEEGTTTTPFDMLVRNRISRYDLASAAVKLACETTSAEQLLHLCQEKLQRHHAYIIEHGIDMPEVIL